MYTNKTMELEEDLCWDRRVFFKLCIYLKVAETEEFREENVFLVSTSFGEACRENIFNAFGIWFFWTQ